MSLSNLSREMFIQYFGDIYEHAPWAAARVYDRGLTDEHADPEVLSKAFQQVVADASVAEKTQLIRNHPDLGAKPSKKLLTHESLREQRSASLDQATSAVFARLHELNKLYWAKFGFPFVMSVQGSSPEQILTEFKSRLTRTRSEEFDTALAEIDKIARKRLQHRLVSSAKDPSGADAESAIAADALQDPDFFPGFFRAVPLGIQHVLAMFVSNVTPAIIIAGAVGFGFGSPDTSDLVYLIQMSMFFAGVATLIQTVSLGPIGARLPIVQGTSFAFLPVMIPIAKVYGMGTLMGGIIAGGVFHFFLGTFIGRLRGWLPPLVTGLVVLMIGLALIRVGIQYAAGGVPLAGTPAYGSLTNWSLALLVIFVTLSLKFFFKGMLSMAAVLIGLLAGYVAAYALGMVDLAGVQKAAWFATPNPLHFGLEFNLAVVVVLCLMSVVSAIETVGDIAGITRTGAGREATDREIAGGTMADGVGTALGGVFGALPNTSFSQNVGLISMTGVMSRHVVSIGALFLIACGLIPKIGSAIQTMPVSVLGGGVIIMFGMVAAAGVNILSQVRWDRRSLLIFGIALSVGLGLQLEPEALQHLPDTLRVLMSTGLLPAAIIAIVLNRLVPNTAQQARVSTQQPAEDYD